MSRSLVLAFSLFAGPSLDYELVPERPPLFNGRWEMIEDACWYMPTSFSVQRRMGLYEPFPLSPPLPTEKQDRSHIASQLKSE